MTEWNNSRRWDAESKANQKARTPRGERHHEAILTANAVREIRTLFPKVSANVLGKRYGVAPGTIRCAAKGRSWKHV